MQAAAAWWPKISKRIGVVKGLMKNVKKAWKAKHGSGSGSGSGKVCRWGTESTESDLDGVNRVRCGRVSRVRCGWGRLDPV